MLIHLEIQENNLNFKQFYETTAFVCTEFCEITEIACNITQLVMWTQIISAAIVCECESRLGFGES